MNTLKKYLFACMVMVYVSSAIGIPVYMHYCGGELETISVLMKGDSCCDTEEEEVPSDCCADQNTFARYSPDFTAKKINDNQISIASLDLFVKPSLKFYQILAFFIENKLNLISPPPKLLQSAIVATTVLII